MSMLVCHNEKMGKSDIRGMEIHNNRESEHSKNDDINKSKTHLNYDLAEEWRNGRSYTETFKDCMKEGYTQGKTLRKDAVCLCSVLVSSDKEFFENLPKEEQDRFFKASYDYLAEQMGRKNIIAGSVHLDEKTPHLHFQFVPLTEDGRLCAKEVVGQKALRNLQRNMPKELQRAGFTIEAGQTREEKVRHKDTYQWKEEQLKIKEKELAAKEITLADKEQELASKEADLNMRFVQEKKISMSQHEVERFSSNAKELTDWLNRPKGAVEVPKEDIDRLTATARAGAVALEENHKLNTEVDRLRSGNKDLREEKLSLEVENTNLKEKVRDNEKMLKHPRVAEKIFEVQNPHIATFRNLKKEAGIHEFVNYGDTTPKYEEVAYQMQKKGFGRDLIQEALRQDLDRDKTYNVMSAADNRFTQERAAAEAAERAAAQKAAAEQARQAQLKALEMRKEKISKNPTYTKYLGYIKQGYNPTSAAYLLMKKDRISEGTTRATVKYMCGDSEKYASKVMKLAKEYKPTTEQGKTVSRASSGGVGGGSSAALQRDTANLFNKIDNLLNSKVTAVPLAISMETGDKSIDWDALTPDQVQDKVRELAIERESHEMSFGR